MMRSNRSGLTLVELTIVFAMIMLLLVATAPIGANVYRAQRIDSTVDNISTTLRNAHHRASAQKNDMAAGVYFDIDTYTLFQGSSYAGRSVSYDEVTDLPNGITTSGITEVVFSKFSGEPSVTGILTVSDGTDDYTVSINAQGKIER